MKISKILIPSDFTENAENTMNYAFDFAKKYNSDIVFIHVCPIPVGSPEFGVSMNSLGDIKRDTAEALESLVATLKSRHNFSSSVECVTEMGNAEEIIVEYVRNNNIDMVLMCVSGGSNIKKKFIGSTALSVAKNVAVPVIMVPAMVSFKPFINIAYACAFSNDLQNSSSLLFVKKVTDLFESVLQVVHVIPDGHLINKEENKNDSAFEDKLKDVTHLTHIIPNDNVSKAILEFSKKKHIDMIIVEPQKHNFFNSLFKASVTDDLAFDGTIPVMTIHG